MKEIIAAYQDGASELGLSRQYGVSRGTISKRLLAAGIPRRGTSQAGIVRASKMTPEQRKAQAASANRAARMRSIPTIQKYRHALHVETHPVNQGSGEHLLRKFLQERGISAMPQRAIGPYNVDLAVTPVAMEVLGGGWHSMKTTHAERTPYILDQGWHLVMVWDYEGRSALGPKSADYLVSFLEEVRGNPPGTCQYRVISGQGEVLAACGREDNEFPLVPPPRGRL
jgi:very-short-patch-repair endonuclease